MELQPNTIKHIQEYVAAKIEERGFADENLHERLLLLAEEIGELIKACRKVNGMNEDQAKQNKYNIGEEVVDVINMALAVAIERGLDMEAEYRKKEAEIDRRTYERSQKV